MVTVGRPKLETRVKRTKSKVKKGRRKKNGRRMISRMKENEQRVQLQDQSTGRKKNEEVEKKITSEK